MSWKNLIISFFLVSTLFFLSASLSFAKADDLVIMDDGRVVLYVTNNVLADSIKNNEEEKKPAAPIPTPAKAVSLAPAHTQSTIKIDAPINNDKKVQVTITTPSPTQAKPPAPQAPTSIQGPINPPSSPSPNTTVVTKTVDQVVAKGAGGQTVFSIKSEKANQLTISQEDTKVKTSLPLQIDSLSHALSVPGSSGVPEPTRISVLPKEAIQGIVSKGVLQSKSAGEAQITLTKDLSGVNYTVDSVKSGKLFGIVSIKAPEEVQLSAQTGKIVPTPKSTILNFFGNFIK